MLNHNDYDHPLEMSKIFGKDSEALYQACSRLMNLSLYPYKDCYRADHPTLSEVRNYVVVPEGSTFGTEFKRILKKWYDEHPEEKAKEEQSRREWEEDRDRQFRIIYGIAKRHGCYISWHGNSSPRCPDRFEVYRGTERIARICC